MATYGISYITRTSFCIMIFSCALYCYAKIFPFRCPFNFIRHFSITIKRTNLAFISTTFCPRHFIFFANITNFLSVIIYNFCCANFTTFFTNNLKRIPIICALRFANFPINFSYDINFGQYYINCFIKKTIFIIITHIILLCFYSKFIKYLKKVTNKMHSQI